MGFVFQSPQPQFVFDRPGPLFVYTGPGHQFVFAVLRFTVKYCYTYVYFDNLSLYLYVLTR